jgi:N-acetylglucosaminyldiphosphoundecaprenol N-acetyl-beta-D-mannosaminyltransferase
MWVGLSTPKQEKFMAEYLEQLEVTLMAGVGAAFDFHAGRVRQAPRWMRRSGLEWLFRLGCEPRRLWKRYLKNNPLFLIRIFCQCAGLRKYPMKHP